MGAVHDRQGKVCLTQQPTVYEYLELKVWFLGIANFLEFSATERAGMNVLEQNQDLGFLRGGMSVRLDRLQAGSRCFGNDNQNKANDQTQSCENKSGRATTDEEAQGSPGGQYTESKTFRF